MYTITKQMLRDTLGFKGPLTVKGLELALDLEYAHFAKALKEAISKGVISRRVIKDSTIGRIEVYYTDWVDDLKGKA